MGPITTRRQLRSLGNRFVLSKWYRVFNGSSAHWGGEGAAQHHDLMFSVLHQFSHLCVLPGSVSWHAVSHTTLLKTCTRGQIYYTPSCMNYDVWLCLVLQVAGHVGLAVPGKDSGSESSNADSGHGSHEDTSSLAGAAGAPTSAASLQKWDNVFLANSTCSYKRHHGYTVCFSSLTHENTVLQENSSSL